MAFKNTGTPPNPYMAKAYWWLLSRVNGDEFLAEASNLLLPQTVYPGSHIGVYSAPIKKGLRTWAFKAEDERDSFVLLYAKEYGAKPVHEL